MWAPQASEPVVLRLAPDDPGVVVRIASRGVAPARQTRLEKVIRTPGVWVIAPLAILGSVVLYFSLPLTAILVLPVWGAIGLLFYFLYSRSRSHVGRA